MDTPVPPPIFVFGFQRSGTNLIFDLVCRSLGAVGYNEDNADAFHNFALKNKDAISSLIQKSSKTSIFKPISNSLQIANILSEHRNAKAIVIFRNPLNVILSYLEEFRASLDQVNGHIYNNFVMRGLQRAGIKNVDWSEIDLILERYSGGFLSSGDIPSKAALFWLLTYTVMLQLGVSEDPNVILICYDDLVKRPSHVSDSLSRWLGVEIVFSSDSIKERGRPFYTDRIDIRVANECMALYKKLSKISNGQR